MITSVVENVEVTPLPEPVWGACGLHISNYCQMKDPEQMGHMYTER